MGIILELCFCSADHIINNKNISNTFLCRNTFNLTGGNSKKVELGQ